MSCINMSLQRQNSIQKNSLDHWVSDIPLVQERDKHAVWLLALLQLLAFRQQNALLGADEIFRTSVNWNKHPPQSAIYLQTRDQCRLCWAIEHLLFAFLWAY